MLKMTSSAGVFAVLGCALAGLAGCSTPNPSKEDLGLGTSAAQAVSINGYVTPVLSSRPALDGYYKHADGSVVYESVIHGTDRFIVCPAPPVDAIATINKGASFTDTLKATFGGTPVSNNAQFALAVAQAAATFGLRTNSTTLLSYNLASNCMAYMGGATENDGYMELTRRNQLITFGILAIDSLTGGSKAGQAALGGTAGAATGAQDTTALTKTVNDATTSVGQKGDARDSVQSEVDAKRAELPVETEKLRSLQAANTKIVAKPTATDQEKADAAKAVADQQTVVNTKKAELRPLETKLSNAQNDLRIANINLDRAQAALEIAEGNVRAQATANALFGPASGFNGANTEVAGAVERIVQQISIVSTNGEFCDSLIRDYIRTPAENIDKKYKEGGAASSFIQACSEVVKEQRKLLRKAQNVPLGKSVSANDPSKGPDLGNDPRLLVDKVKIIDPENDLQNLFDAQNPKAVK